MRIAMFSLLWILMSAPAAKADTIDYWHVYYNQKKIKEFTTAGDIVLKRSKIKPGDIITLKYFRDTPCSDCEIYFTAEDEQGHTISKGVNKGTGTPVSISVDLIMAYMEKAGISIINLYYREGEIINGKQKKLIGTIRLK